MKEVKMTCQKYAEEYSDCETKPSSYNEKENTIIVYVPDKSFCHYGVKINVRHSYKGIEYQLKKSRIEYIALPLLDEKVFRFYKNGKRYYAYCCIHEFDEISYEIAYITTDIPEDMSWQNIEEDYLLQQEGYPPMEMKTRARVLYDEAHHRACDLASQTCKTFLEWMQEVSKTELEVALASVDTTLNELFEMDHHDVPELEERYK